MIESYTSLHNHSEYSSAVLRFSDAICKIAPSVNWCYDNGLRGYAISDHQTVAGYVELEQAALALNKERPFQHIFANEGYLITRKEEELREQQDIKPSYWHYLTIVLDEEGLHQMYELSSRAWLRSYTYRGLLRRPWYPDDFEEIVGKNPGHIISSSACFTKNNEVKTKTGYKKISQIKAGEYVLSSDGNYYLINAPTSREYCGEGNELTFEKCFSSICCTSDHKFLKLERGEVFWCEAKDLKEKDICLEPIKKINYNYSTSYNTSEVTCLLSLIKSKRLNRIKETIFYSYDLFRALGYWLADGYLHYKEETGSYTVGFTINLEEFSRYKEWLIKGMREICDFEPCISVNKKNHKVDVCYNSKELAFLFKHWFGNVKAESKNLPDWLTEISPEYNKELLFGYLLGDGYFRYRSNYGGEIIANSISKALIHQIAELFLQIGLSPSYKIVEEKTDKNLTHHKKSYYINVSCGKLSKFLNKSQNFSHEELNDLLKPYTFLNSKFIQLNNHWYAKKQVKKNLKKFLKERVYCLNVNAIHNFVCNGVIVHNCIGGFLPHCLLEKDYDSAKKFVEWNQQVFGKDNFYLECQPCFSDNEEQIIVNQRLWDLHKLYEIPIIVTTDSHFQRPEDRKIHRALLLSKDGGDSREPEKFYQTTYLFTPQELREILYNSSFSDTQIDTLFQTTNDIADRIQPFTLKKKTRVPALPVYPEFQIRHIYKEYYDKYPEFKRYAYSDNEHEQYYFYQVEKGLEEYAATHEINLDEYIAQINIEMEQVTGLGEIFGECMSDYFVTVQKLVDIIWNEGDSLVGIGRGSAGAYLTDRLLGITGIDPMLPEHHEFYPWWRFCSTARSDSIFDIDIDIQSFQKEKIIQAVKDYFGERRVCQCVAWAKLSAKTALERAGRGLNISPDTIGYLKSLIPIVRGSVYSLKDCVYGNEKKGRKPVPEFIKEINKYPDLLDVALGLEGLIVSSSVHAGALNILKSDFTETGSLMVSTNGAVISQYDLHHAEYCGDLKMDLLSIDALEMIRSCMNLLLKAGKIQWQGSLRATYNKYLGYDALEKDSPEMWALLPTMSDAFQYDSRAGQMVLRKIGAKNLTELSLANGLMRLAVPDGEQPIDKYVRYRNDINEWYKDMTEYGLTQEEQEIFKKYLGRYSGVLISQEQMMSILMAPDVCNFTMKESDKARKAVAKFLAC